LAVSGGIPAWASVTGGPGGICTDCLVSDPSSTQIITPAGGTTGLSVKQASGGSVDIFRVTDNTGNISYLDINSSGNVQLGSGQTSAAILTVAPANTDPIAISPYVQGTTLYVGTITSQVLTITGLGPSPTNPELCVPLQETVPEQQVPSEVREPQIICRNGQVNILWEIQ